MTQKVYSLFFILIFFAVSACSFFTSQQNESTLFELLPSSKTNIRFQNDLSPTKELNTYTYRNFYNGGGVAIGDINNDGMQDVFFTGNQVNNRLYLNLGDFKFEDITRKAGVASEEVWSTGVSMADINGDGWLDIYVCKSGPPGGKNRKNELFINNGDSTFTEMAEAYGLAVEGLAVHASFFDYDRDGDLDMYLVSNPIRSFNNAEMVDGSERKNFDPEGGNRLFRNELISNGKKNSSNIHFTDVTREAGIYSSKIGFGLGVSVGDVNRDDWPDLYISNDFFERDYLYLNNSDGTFREALEESMGSISLSSMGGDIADLNHDGYPEIFVSDMRGGNERRLKMNTKYSSWEEYRERVEKGYHHQFERNTLQLNHGRVATDSSNTRTGDEIPEVYFSEISRLAGVEGTDWSWGALIADFNLDGQRDIFVPNGIYKDLLNQDYLDKMSDPRTVRSVLKQQEGILKLVDMIPSTPVPNALFVGEEKLQFENKATEWGVAQPSFSNGAAYGDLDNDGDLDLVVNNVNMETFVYRNRAADTETKNSKSLQITLEGNPPNTYGVGAQVTAWADGKRWYTEQQPIRSFQSSVSPGIHLGLGGVRQIDSLLVRWPDGSLSKETSLTVNQRITINQPESSSEVKRSLNLSANPEITSVREGFSLLKEILPESLGLAWQHRENEFNDFNRQPLSFHMRSTEGPPVCKGDLNGDGLSDLFFGGAKDQPAILYIQNSNGKFNESSQTALQKDQVSEDTACELFDANGDGSLDLYVGSGGSEFPASSSALSDRLYLNDGRGNLQRSNTRLVPPVHGYRPTGAVSATDYDGDGDIDLFVGDRMQPFSYGLPVDGHLLINDGTGQFEPAVQPVLKELGMITDAEWFDHDEDGDKELWVVGEWMPITVLENRDGELVVITDKAGLNSTTGWWQSLVVVDLDGDGDRDIIGGNHGWNSIFKASSDQPLELWAGDLDQNGGTDQIVAVNKEEGAFPVALRDDMLEQIQGLRTQFLDYDSYGGQTVAEIFSDQQLQKAVHREAEQLGSIVAWNQGNGTFRVEPLPLMAQLSPIFGMATADLNADQIPELLAGGNLHAVKPQVGRYDATHGLVLTRKASGELRYLSAGETGFFVRGEVRSINTIEIKDNLYILVARSDGELSIFELQN